MPPGNHDNHHHCFLLLSLPVSSCPLYHPKKPTRPSRKWHTCLCAYLVFILCDFTPCIAWYVQHPVSTTQRCHAKYTMPCTHPFMSPGPSPLAYLWAATGPCQHLQSGPLYLTALHTPPRPPSTGLGNIASESSGNFYADRSVPAQLY